TVTSAISSVTSRANPRESVPRVASDRRGTPESWPTPCHDRDGRRTQFFEEKRPALQAPARNCSPVGRLLTRIAQSGADRNVDRREGDGLLVPLQFEADAEDAGPKHVLDCEAPLDLRLAGLVGGAVIGRLRLRAVAPVPLDGRTVVLLVVVRS